MERLELFISESLGSLKERLELLISENCHLRDLLAKKEREVLCLSLQVSEAAEKMSEHSMAEAKLLKTTANLKSAVEDAHIEALLVEDTYACILRGMMDQINCIVETVFQQVEEMVSSAKASVCERQQEQKSLSVSDIGHLSSHGSLEVDEESNNYKKGDRSHHKVLNNLKSSLSLSLMSSSTLTSTSTSLSEENGKHDELERSMQERFDVNRLTHMSTDELKSYLTKLKRSHESQVQDLTEQIYSLRRDSLKERGDG